MMKKKRIYIDMDGVLCNFKDAALEAIQKNPKQPYPQSQWGFFLKLKPIDDAIYAFKHLSAIYDVWILTKPSTRNVNCYTEKAQWILDHLGEEALEKLVMSCDKNLLKGDYLIDDNVWEFEGEHIHFDTDEFPDWTTVIEYIHEKELNKSGLLCDPLRFEDLKIGMKVIDEDANIGIIKDCQDPHNVLVESINPDKSCLQYCLIADCVEKRKMHDGSEIEINHHDPLYRF